MQNIKLILSIFINLIPVFLLGQTNILVSENNKYGIINFEGKEIVPIEFDMFGNVSENIIALNKGAVEKDYEKIGGKWGFWHIEGREIIAPKYEEATIFKEGLAPVKLNGKYGFIDVNDNTIIDFKYKYAQPFYEGLAAVLINDKWGFINKKGDFVIQPSFDRVDNFDNGFSVVFHQKESYGYEEDSTYEETYGKYGLIDKKGTLKLDTIYDHIGEFKNGFAKIELKRKEGFINTKGEIAIPIQFDKVENFSEGLAVVANYMLKDSDYNFGYSQEQIDSLEQEFMNLLKDMSEKPDTSLSNNILDNTLLLEVMKARKQQPSEKLMHGYINEKGEVVIDLQFDNAENFWNGLAKVRFGGQFGGGTIITRIDENGKEKRLPTPYELSGFGMNLIDKKGNLKLKSNHSIINRYQDSIFIMYTYHDEVVVINESFEEVFQDERNINYLGSGYFVVGENHHQGQKKIIGNGIDLELDEKFWRVKAVFKDKFLVDYIIDSKGRSVVTKSGIINQKGEWILKPKYDFSTILD